MKSYEEMAQNVFRRGREYFRRKEKRNAAVRNMVSVMSMLGVFTLVGMEILSSPSSDAPTPDIPRQIEIVEIHTVIQTVTEISTVSAETAGNMNTGTAAPEENSLFGTMQPAFTTEPVITTASPVTMEDSKKDNIPADIHTESNISLESEPKPESAATATETETETTAAITSCSTDTSSDTQSKPASDVMDVNGDGAVDILDAIYVLIHYSESGAGLR
ncbi:MAG: hypothetical protein ACI4JN_08015 [Ruminococcus sp.]